MDMREVVRFGRSGDGVLWLVCVSRRSDLSHRSRPYRVPVVVIEYWNRTSLPPTDWVCIHWPLHPAFCRRDVTRATCDGRFRRVVDQIPRSSRRSSDSTASFARSGEISSNPIRGASWRLSRSLPSHRTRVFFVPIVTSTNGSWTEPRRHHKKPTRKLLCAM